MQAGGEGHFVLQRKADDVEVIKRGPALQAVQGQAVFPHLFLHVHPGREDAFAEGVFTLVDEVVEDLDAEVGHADFIGVRETERKVKVDRRRVFRHTVQFAANVAAGFLDQRQDPLKGCIHPVSSSLQE